MSILGNGLRWARAAGVAGAAWAAISAPALAEQARMSPEQAYIGVNRAAPVLVTAGDSGDHSGRLEIALLEPVTARIIERRRIEPGRVDLSAVFPLLWTRSTPTTVYAQLFDEGRPVGAALVIRPLLSPPRATDGLTAALRDAAAARLTDELGRLGTLPADRRGAMRRLVHIEPAPATVLSGLKITPDRHVVLETSEGPITLALRHDAAPNTCEAFLELVEGGLYTDVPFHRVVGASPGRRPFVIQTGDPTGSGDGGAGRTINFEPSPIPHDFGVVSMARRDDDPNSAGSQFFICLSREACQSLDGAYVGFAHVVDGAGAVGAISRTPVGPRNPDDPLSPHDRPLNPPVLLRAFTRPAPPHGTGPRPATPADVPPVDR